MCDGDTKLMSFSNFFNLRNELAVQEIWNAAAFFKDSLIESPALEPSLNEAPIGWNGSSFRFKCRMKQLLIWWRCTLKECFIIFLSCSNTSPFVASNLFITFCRNCPFSALNSPFKSTRWRVGHEIRQVKTTNFFS